MFIVVIILILLFCFTLDFLCIVLTTDLDELLANSGAITLNYAQSPINENK